MARAKSTGVRALQYSLRADLPTFIEKAFRTLHPGTEYVDGWHVEAIAYQLTRLLGGEERQLVITQPPRTLKSICTSVAFVAWALGNNPTLNFVCVSYSQDLALDLARKFRKLISTPWYQETFPRTRLSRDTDALIETTQGGGRITASVGGTITGRGANVIIIDDPLKAEEAHSESARTNVISWYRNTLLSRFNDQNTGRLVLVMQRLHEEDLAGQIAGNGYHLDLPAIAIEPQRVPLGNGRIHVREPGDLLDPMRLPEEVLERIRTGVGSLTFSAQYQQRPTPIEGNLVKREWFQHYRTLPRSDQPQIVQSWDVAGSLDGDYSVCTTWAVMDKHAYLIARWRGRLEFPALQQKAFELADHHSPRTILVEKAGLGLSLYQALREADAVSSVIGIDTNRDKTTRFEGVTPHIEGGYVHLPEEAPWLAGYLSELLGFPNARYDDQVDSTSQFLNWLIGRQRPAPGIGYCEAIPLGDSFEW